MCSFLNNRLNRTILFAFGNKKQPLLGRLFLVVRHDLGDQAFARLHAVFSGNSVDEHPLAEVQSRVENCARSIAYRKERNGRAAPHEERNGGKQFTARKSFGEQDDVV